MLQCHIATKHYSCGRRNYHTTTKHHSFSTTRHTAMRKLFLSNHILCCRENFFFFPDISHYGETIFLFQQPSTVQEKRFSLVCTYHAATKTLFFPMACHTATKVLFLSNHTSYCNENIFFTPYHAAMQKFCLSQRQILPQRKAFCFLNNISRCNNNIFLLKTNRTARKPFFFFIGKSINTFNAR